ncbi:MAG: DNA methyltransferase [Tepidisphaera sp.]|nr:DNA methyltransferase [Tepidisphaera sp.]
MIKYIGSKRVLVPSILDAVRGVPGVRTVVDLFSGTSRVGHALKRHGYRVLANDHNEYAETLARCYVQADADLLPDAARIIDELRTLPGRPGYFTHTFCEQSRYIHPRNGERIDAIRDAIEAKGLNPELKAVVLTSLVEAADRVDSTTGLQMAYLKSWAPRAANPLDLRLPDVLPRASAGKGQATCLDALDAASMLEGDVAYLDPPYNQHSYLGNYHVWESLVRWDKPEVYGVACKRIDVRDRRSDFNSRRKFREAFATLLARVRCPVLVVSFSNEGFISRDEMEALLGSLWGGNAAVTTHEHAFKRYVGAQIGIHNPRGERVGQVSHLTNKEFIYVAAHARDEQSESRDRLLAG